MEIMPRRLFGLLLSIAIVGGAGCSGSASAPQGSMKSLVSGAVKVKGRPVASGEVTFHPTGESAAGAEPLKAQITNGNYEAGLMTGKYRVRVQTSRRGKVATPVAVPKQLDV